MIDVLVQRDGADDILMKSQKIYIEPEGSFKLSPLLDQINELGLELVNCHISYFSDWKNSYVFAGEYPSSEIRLCRVTCRTINWETGRFQIKVTEAAATATRHDDSLTPTGKLDATAD